MKEFIKKIFNLLGYTIGRKKVWHIQNEKQITKNNFFDLYFSKIDPSDFFFIEIGANDGKVNDPMYPYITKYKLRGIAVEPQPDVFALLKKTYADYPNVQCVNAAISHQTGKQPFYMVKEEVKTKDNYARVTGIATLKKSVLQHTIKKKIPKGVNVDDYIQEVLVDTISFNDLLKSHNVNKVDLVQLDCEGYDYEIIKMIDFDKFSPSIINFESSHLSNEDRIECETMLESRGYKWFRHGIDTCAYKMN